MQKLKNFGLLILLYLLKGLISLRYRLRIEGLEGLILPNPERGALFLPNHSAEIEPVFLILALWKRFKPHPLVIQYFYESKGVLPFMKLVDALSLPNMYGSSNQWKLHQVEKLFNRIATGLAQKENFLIYPSGRLKLQSKEVLGGASFVHTLLQQSPDANVVLIRTRGLWGSAFSRALTGKVPPFGQKIFESVVHILKNGIFFSLRREVVIEVALAPQALPVRGNRLEFNRFLEEWYNQKPDLLNLVSYTFWKKTLPKVAVTNGEVPTYEKLKVPENVRQEIVAKLAALSHRSEHDILDESDLATDLGLDSLDFAQIYAFLDDVYDVTGIAPGALQNVADVLHAAIGQVKEVAPEREKKKLRWPREKQRPNVTMPEGKTLQEVFLNSCDRMDGATACSDGLMEICLSYRRLKMVALALAVKMQAIKGKYVGIMLPSSVGAYLCILAALLAKKVPVMLNWTVGSRAIDHAAEVTQLKDVFCSRRFLERLESLELGSVEDKLILLEDFRSSLSVKDKMRAFFLGLLKPQKLLQKLDLKSLDENEPAVILFTSGTEALPKGVPLSHKNILSNLRASYSFLGAQSSDILYAILPPFHSFGFSVTGILPLLLGLKVCYSPDPTDSRRMASDVDHWKATILCAAPSFLTGMFHVAKEGQLNSVRLVVSGAEKAPQELFDAVARLPDHAELIEGYGITECSPIVTINHLQAVHKGVGQALGNLKLCTINPETLALLPHGEEGEICIQGSSVFSGYLGEEKDPFIEIEGQKWYRSGDRGYIDVDGNLILSGRLKRFIKMGGEMVSLGGIEEDLTDAAKEKAWIPKSTQTPQLAISAKENEGGKPLIILYATFAISREAANEALKEKGAGRLVKIAEVRHVEEIPLSGTGKVQHRKLDQWV